MNAANTLRRRLDSMLEVEPHPGGFTAQLRVSADLEVFPDHFPGSPILPGMCLIQSVLLAAARAQKTSPLTLTTLKNAKFTGPVLPGAQVTIEAQVARGGATG